MASIHKDPRGKSPFWYCAYRLPNGKRVFRSTKLTDRKAAEEFCRRLEYASNESKAGRLTEARAHELISEIVEQTSGEPLRNYSAEDWLTDWLQGKKSAKTESTFLKYANAVKGFLTSLGPRAKLNVNQIAPRDVHRFRQGEVDAGKHPSTCNDHVKIVRMAFTAARRQGLITHNPAEAVEMLPVDSEPVKEPFSIEQIKALLRAAEGDWRGAIMVTLYTGMRLKDVANLRWENVVCLTNGFHLKQLRRASVSKSRCTMRFMISFWNCQHLTAGKNSCFLHWPERARAARAVYQWPSRG